MLTEILKAGFAGWLILALPAFAVLWAALALGKRKDSDD